MMRRQGAPWLPRWAALITRPMAIGTWIDARTSRAIAYRAKLSRTPFPLWLPAVKPVLVPAARD